MQAASDIFLGVTEDPKTNRQFYVGQLKNRHLGSIGEVIEAKALEDLFNITRKDGLGKHATDPRYLPAIWENRRHSTTRSAHSR